MPTPTKRPPTKPAPPLPVRKDASLKVKGGARTTVKDAHDKFANG